MKQLLVRASAVVMTTGLLLTSPMAVLAQSSGNPFEQARNQAEQVGGAAGIQNNRELPEIVGSIINIILGFLGIVLLLLILYAGFLWMTAGGNTEQIEKARAFISNSIIGLIIVVAAFAISNFVLSSLVNVTQ